jgi:hypothetical protein
MSQDIRLSWWQRALITVPVYVVVSLAVRAVWPEPSVDREAGWKACAAMCAERPLKVAWHTDGSLTSCECDAVPFVETE